MPVCEQAKTGVPVYCIGVCSRSAYLTMDYDNSKRFSMRYKRS